MPLVVTIEGIAYGLVVEDVLDADVTGKVEEIAIKEIFGLQAGDWGAEILPIVKMRLITGMDIYVRTDKIIAVQKISDEQYEQFRREREAGRTAQILMPQKIKLKE
jgi:hypothetical protein